MKTGRMDLQQLLVELQRRRETKRDYLVNIGKVEATVAETDKGKSLELLVPTEAGFEAVGVNGVAHGQIAEEAGIPKPYYDKMLKEEPELLTTNINKWFQKYPAVRQIRTLDGSARALLSDKYRPLDYEDLAEVVIPALLKLDSVEIMSQEITERRFYLKAVDKGVIRELADKGATFGDGGHTIIQRRASPAITISDSEVGFGALSIQVGLYDGFCSNLATFGERSLRKYHTGARQNLLAGVENIAALLTDDTRRKTDEAIWAQVGDVVAGAFDKDRFNELCGKVEGTIADKIEGDVAKVIANKRFGLTENEGKSVLQRLIEGGSNTRFGFYNAITRAAQDVEDYERATELERLGGEIIDLPRDQWQEVLKQAA